MTKTKTNSPRKKATVGILVAGFLSASFGFALSQATNTREVRAYQSVEQYYANANTSSGSALLTSLQSITTKGSDVGSYDDLFETYRSSDVKDGYLVDMYSNTTRYTVDQKRCGNYKNEGDCWNREHSTPKSWWGGSKSNQGADPFILYPTDGKINGMRSSYPFGEVKTIEKASNNNYSLLGSADNSLYPYSGKVFEPADEWKGDLARSAFYTRARWSASYSWSSGGGNVIYSGSASNNFGLTDYAVKLYTAWSNLDPVDEWELRRNEAIYAIQGNRNPFIDHPEYANIIWGGTTYTGGGATTPPNTITLNPASSSIAVGATVSLSVSVDSGSSQVTWSSNKTNVATVSGGTVTGIGAGTATITATSILDTSVKGTAVITVTDSSTERESGGCGGSIAVTSGIIAALSIVGISFILIKKKKLSD
ncbi:MAG TPA: endonuclease [Bacilli bacterium]|nr:endonuclease [Bacilli bacterium]HQA56132.1 endonuclease [Bacilli bacterium]